MRREDRKKYITLCLIEQSTWEAKNYSADKTFSAYLQNPKVPYYHFHTNPPLFPNISQKNPVLIIFRFFKTHFKITESLFCGYMSNLIQWVINKLWVLWTQYWTLKFCWSNKFWNAYVMMNVSVSTILHALGCCQSASRVFCPCLQPLNNLSCFPLPRH